MALLYRTYDRRGENAISFDLFVQACISLKRMTDVFKKYDEDRDGYITLSLSVLTSLIPDVSHSMNKYGLTILDRKSVV